MLLYCIYGTGMMFVCLSICVSVTLVDYDYIMQEKVEMGI